MKVIAVLPAVSRKSGQRVEGIKGVIYGKEVASQAIAVDRSGLEKLYHQAGQNTVIDVVIDDAQEPHKALFQDVQLHPVTGSIIHFDLHAVSLKDKVQAEVPIQIIGESQIIILNEGILTTVQEMVEVESAPMSIPEAYTIDISKLVEVNDNVTIADLPVLEGVTILSPEDNVLVKIDAIVEQTVEEEEPVGGEAGEEGGETGEAAADSAEETPAE